MCVFRETEKQKRDSNIERDGERKTERLTDREETGLVISLV